MLQPILKTCAVSCLLMVSFQSFAASTDPVAKVNDKTLTQKDYDDYVAMRAEQMGDNKPVDSKVIIEGMVNRELVMQDAIKQGIEKSEEFQKRFDAIRGSILAEIAVRQYVDKHPVEDSTLKTRYDEIIKQIQLPKEYKVRHILVETEEEGKAILAELDGGKNFGDLAKEKSKDAASKDKGGDLDWVTDDAVAFGGELAAMEKGKRMLTKTKFGWHVVTLEGSRSSPPPSFESVKSNLKNMVQAEMLQKYIGELRKAAKIEVLKKDEAAKKDDAKPTTDAESKK